MFFKQVVRNSRRSRKENGLFFVSLLISIVAFYIILSLSHQDVMIFLTKMESDAVNRLMTMIPIFYGVTLFILFFLIYYASKFQMERRRHEFGVYLMMGMGRPKLFAMLLAEDFGSSIIALTVGLPIAVLLSELISLVTARLAGLGIIGHQISFSWQAALWTAIGFIFIKLGAFLILSGKMARQEIGSLLVEHPEGTKKQMPPFIYGASLTIGIIYLAGAYGMVISGVSWSSMEKMGLAVVLGLVGTLLLFYGLRFLIGLFAIWGNKSRQLRVFNFRQLQENVIHRSSSLAISSLLILAALCCFGAGVSIARFYGNSQQHVLDYTFQADGNDTVQILKALADAGLDTQFSHLFDMKIGSAETTDDYDNAFQMEEVMSALSNQDKSDDRDGLLHNLSLETYPYLIPLSCYNQLLTIADSPVLALESDEAGVYMNGERTSHERIQLFNRVMENKPRVQLDGRNLYLKGTVQTVNMITDRSITLSFALILPDEVFEYYTRGKYRNVYLNGVLDTDKTENTSLMTAISEMNGSLDKTGLPYESYLQNMGRQLFYVVAASYIMLYLSIIFFVAANTVIGVQFLMGQQKSSRRYQTLIRLGATYEALCQSSNKQINWYFGIPIVIAAVSSLFGVRGLFTGLLPERIRSNFPEMLLVSGAMIAVLCVIEYSYMAMVKRSGSRYLLTLMELEREE